MTAVPSAELIEWRELAYEYVRVANVGFMKKQANTISLAKIREQRMTLLDDLSDKSVTPAPGRVKMDVNDFGAIRATPPREGFERVVTIASTNANYFVYIDRPTLYIEFEEYALARSDAVDDVSVANEDVDPRELRWAPREVLNIDENPYLVEELIFSMDGAEIPLHFVLHITYVPNANANANADANACDESQAFDAFSEAPPA